MTYRDYEAVIVELFLIHNTFQLDFHKTDSSIFI